MTCGEDNPSSWDATPGDGLLFFARVSVMKLSSSLEKWIASDTVVTPYIRKRVAKEKRRGAIERQRLILDAAATYMLRGNDPEDDVNYGIALKSLRRKHPHFSFSTYAWSWALSAIEAKMEMWEKRKVIWKAMTPWLLNIHSDFPAGFTVQELLNRIEKELSKDPASYTSALLQWVRFTESGHRDRNIPLRVGKMLQFLSSCEASPYSVRNVRKGKNNENIWAILGPGLEEPLERSYPIGRPKGTMDTEEIKINKLIKLLTENGPPTPIRAVRDSVFRKYTRDELMVLLRKLSKKGIIQMQAVRRGGKDTYVVSMPKKK